MPGTTRQEMIATAVKLFQRDGYSATTWRGLVKEAGTPWGSIQHHFPGGKEELAVSAVEAATSVVSRTIAKAFREHDAAAAAVRWWFGKAAEVLEGGNYRTGCPLATVALEKAHDSELLTATMESSFRAWLSQLVAALALRGADREQAERLAMAILTSLEGSLVLARVLGDVAPIMAAADFLEPSLSGLQIPPATT
jgi:TetR/AcrR family transcriptional repressor of lmrAB and yxaGH operons